MAASSSSSTVEEQPPKHLVFINYFRGKELSGGELHFGFVSHLVAALKSNNINVYIDSDEDRGELKEILLKRIEESRIALVILSTKYTKSIRCLRELAKINDCEKGNLVAIPIFYKLDVSTVRYLKGDFGDNFRSLSKFDERKEKWEKALMAMPEKMDIEVPAKSDESQKIKNIVEAVKKVLNKIPSEGSQKASVDLSENIDTGTSAGGEKDKTFGIKQRLTELGDKLDLQKYKETRFIGVVGMPGIGKTTLLKELYRTLQRKFSKHKFIDQSHLKSDNFGVYSLATELLKKPAPKFNNAQIDDSQKPYNAHKGLANTHKVLVVLDDVSRREQIYALLGKYDLLQKHEWIKDGSRIVIATNDMSLIEGLVNDTYVVRQLNHRDSLQLFRYHAFDDDQANPPKGDFMKVSEDFLQYAKGHPLALKILGSELHGKSMKHWEGKLKLLAQNPSTYIGKVLQVSYEELSSEQQDAFLDIACFRSEDVDYVESLLASADPRSSEATSAVKALTNKFLINTCDGRVEMHDLLYKFSRKLDQDGSTQRRLWLHKDIIKDGAINILHNTLEPANVRGIFLDLNEVKDEMSLEYNHFSEMANLRYIKFYNSHCPWECKTDNKINMIDKLELPLKEVRCLHWLKFPLKKLPNDFDPTNLVDLRLPYSEIKKLWKDDKDTPSLKWVDLNHSIKLSTLSGLKQAQSLQRLNLEGCIALETFPRDMVEMKSLAFLNLKGCTSLKSLPVMNLISLKTIILSGCSKFKEFPSISENLEALYLEGTAISELPADNVVKLKRLILLNMKDCKNLKNIPTCVIELEALQKLVLSGCSELLDFPEINKSSIRILLLDGTSIKMMPQLSSVQYLCLSRNDQISCLLAGINQLSQLTWLDLKYCTKLTSVPELPPNLQYLDAHGCSSLKTVAKPLARIMPTMQNHCTFNFTNCDSLEQAAKEEITSYAQRKCQLLSDARKHYNEGLSSEALFSTCFPGCEVPSWFCYIAVGSLLQRKLNPHWHDKRLSGISLCAVVSFPNCKDQISCFSVTCIFTIKAADKSWIPFTCPVGSWTLEGVEKDKIESDHVFIAYITCPHTIRCLDDENPDKCNFTEASLEFTVTGGTSMKGKFTVLSCGLSLVYAKDKNNNSSHEAKYDMPVEISIQEPQDGMLEEQRNLKNQEDIIDGQRRCEKTEGVKFSSVAQSCGASVTQKMENLQANGSKSPRRG